MLGLELWMRFNAFGFIRAMLCCYIYIFVVKCEMLIHLASNARCKMGICLVSHNHVFCVTMIDLYTKKLVSTAFIANGL